MLFFVVVVVITFVVIRFVISALPYFTWLMIVVTVATLAVQIREVVINSDKSSATYIWWIDLFFIIFAVIELVLKVRVGDGCDHIEDGCGHTILALFCADSCKRLLLQS